MTIQYRYFFLCCLLAGGVGAAVNRYFTPQSKSTETSKEVTHSDVQTVTHTVTAPNGTIDTTTTVVDHSQRIDTDHKTITLTPLPPNYLVSAKYGIAFTSPIPMYGVQVQRRIVGPIFGGVGIDFVGKDVYGTINGSIEF